MSEAECQNSALPPEVRALAASGEEKRLGGIGEARREAEVSKVPMFTAREIADALGGITKQAVLARLAGIPADGPKTVRGQTAQAWCVESFPVGLFAELDSLCSLPDGTRRFRTVGDLIAKRPAPSKLPASSHFPANALALAERKAEILAPLLHARAKSPQKWPLAEIARRACEHLANMPGGKRPRTVEEWARTAEDRDGHRHQFEDARLYLPKAAAIHKSIRANAESVNFPALDSLFVECEADPSPAARASLWHSTFQAFAHAVACGYSAKATRLTLIHKLAKSPKSPLYPTDPALLAKAWRRKFPLWHEGGQTPEALADGRTDNARPVKFELTRDEELCLRGHNLRRGSLALAVEWLAKDARCLPSTRAAILETLDNAARTGRLPHWPDSIRKAGHVTEEEQATFRGTKAMQNFESCDRRGLTWIDERGQFQPLLPGALWESDDMSSNVPFRYSDPETGATQLGRQMLFTQDVFSAAYLGFTPIGRVRDAYRVEDIADHMLALVESHGLPSAWRLERGVWENTFIDGLDVEMLTGKEGEKWGGLDALFAVLRTWKSRGKGSIETSFNFLQSLIAHASTDIGRSRGEFEQATKDFLRAQGGNADSAAKFWDIAACADGYVNACNWFNARPKKRRAHGKSAVVADDLFRAAVRRECPASELWRFLPVKRKATVRQGALEMSVHHYPMPFRFRVNGAHASDLYLEHGYPVLVAFHPGKPELGCHVFNAETGPRNRDGHRFGAHLLTASLAEDAPQFSLSRTEQDAFAMRRKAAAAVRTEFRAIMPGSRRSPSGSIGATGTSVARDGRGNSVEIARNTAPRQRRAPTDETPESIRGRELAGMAQRLNKRTSATSRSETDYDALSAQLAAEDAKRESSAFPQ